MLNLLNKKIPYYTYIYFVSPNKFQTVLTIGTSESAPENSTTLVTLCICLAQTRLSEVLSQLPTADLAFQGVVHQILSPISNSESTIFLTNIYYDFFFQLANLAN